MGDLTIEEGQDDGNKGCDCHNDCPVHKLQGGHGEVAVALDVETLLPFQGWGEVAVAVFTERHERLHEDLVCPYQVHEPEHKFHVSNNLGQALPVQQLKFYT